MEQRGSARAQAADIPMIFALNKMDRDTANPDKVETGLSEMNILVEGGEASTSVRKFLQRMVLTSTSYLKVLLKLRC